MECFPPLMDPQPEEDGDELLYPSISTFDDLLSLALDILEVSIFSRFRSFTLD